MYGYAYKRTKGCLRYLFEQLVCIWANCPYVYGKNMEQKILCVYNVILCVFKRVRVINYHTNDQLGMEKM